MPKKARSKPSPQVKHRQGNEGQYLFTFALLTFVLANSIAAYYAPILDCDEVYNYWEPTHYLNHGFGLQTWEYSPQYAIRSWLYIALHAIIGQTSKLKINWLSTRAHEFYIVRLALGGACAICQTSLFTATYRLIEPRVATLLALVMLSSTGMFYASVSYLPSSFSMYCSMLGTAAFLQKSKASKTTAGILWFGIGAIVGWPFSAALILPLMFEELNTLLLTKDLKSMIQRTFLGVLGLVPVIVSPYAVITFRPDFSKLLDLAFNAVFFRRLVFSPWRIVSYNVFEGSSKGPNIFGTEPWHFYFRNLVLNFHIWSLLALLAGPIILLRIVFGRQSVLRITQQRSLIYIAPFYLWLAIFSAQPHKEERFMYPAYPFLCLNAAITLHTTLSLFGHAGPKSILSRVPSQMKAIIVAIVILALAVIGTLRTLGTISAYQAPLQIYKPLQSLPPDGPPSTLCLGKEWYRFPSSYFLPFKTRAQFVKSEFSGLLPGQFSEEKGQFGLPASWRTPSGMNDENLEDPNKYVGLSSSSPFLLLTTARTGQNIIMRFPR